MKFWELFLIAVGLSMDAFAVSVCKGLTARRGTPGQCLAAGAYFGGFQALMPLLGYLLGTGLASFVAKVDHWITFLLLGFIGLGMVRESRSCGECQEMDASFGPRTMLPLAVATSIDALAVGVSAAFLEMPALLAAGVIGGVAFGLSFLGAMAGRALGGMFCGCAQLVGGVSLIALGFKFLIERLG